LLSSRNHLNSLPRHFNVSFPDELVRDVLAAKAEAEVQEIGVAFARKQVEELLNAKVPCIHFYVMQQAQTVKQLIQGLGI